MKTDYPFVKCLNPKRIYNPALGRYIIVGCGHCEACLLKKSQVSAQKCRIESNYHKYNYFVTLTYNDENIPLVTPIYGNTNQIQLFFKTPRFGLSECSTDYRVDDYESFRKFLVKCGHDGDIAVLCKRDLILFNKRLRKHFTNEKLRYYAVGEYGPEHFRPHYHIIYNFDSDRVALEFEKAVRTSWPFGFCKVELVKGDCARYVAGYVNSFATVPKILKHPQYMPFCCHSIRYAEQPFEAHIEKIYNPDTDFDSIIKRTVSLGERSFTIDAWRSYTSRVFPRQIAYGSRSRVENFRAITLLREIRVWFKTENLSDVVKDIVNICVDNCIHFDMKYHKESFYDRNVSSLLHFIVFLLGVDFRYVHYGDSMYNTCITRLYDYLRKSKYFIDVISKDMLNDSKCFVRIEKFYNYLDKQNLSRFYTSQSDYFSTNDFSLDKLDLFYDSSDTVDCIKSSYSYEKFRAQTKKKFNDAIKHKRQNDINNIFKNV